MHAASALLLLSLAGTPHPGAPERWDAPWDGASFRLQRDAGSGLGLPVPFSGFHLELRHAPPGEERPGVARHQVVISGPWGPEVTVDVWHNAERLALDRWVERYLPFLYESEPALYSGTATARGVPSLGFWHPRTGQAFSRRTVVFAADARVVRVTAEDADAPRVQRIFDEVVARLELEVTP